MTLAELEQELLEEIEQRSSRPTRFVVRWAGLLEPSVDMLSATITLGWALLFFLKTDIFVSAPSYAALSALATAPTWAVLLLFSGLLQLFGVAVRKPPVRLIAQTGAAAQWFFMCIMFSQTSVGGVKTGAVTYGMLALFLVVRTLIKTEK
jgi:hypothetical protein